MKCIRSYLSRGNIETNLDAWITAVDGEDAGNKADVRDYLRGLTAPPEDTITISINLANYLLSGIDYLDPYEGSQILLGRNSFSTEIDDMSIVTELAEERNHELPAGLRTLDERQITDRSAIPFF